MARYFGRIGCQVSTAREREEAEALLSHQSFDLVILDLGLTSYGMEGLEILREIRYGSMGTPVVILSALVTPEIEADALRRGADAVLAKPQPLADLAAVAARLMGVRS
jgi:DNA-binding response OmpR family regulator